MRRRDSVGLNYNCGARLAVIAGDHGYHDIAASHGLGVLRGVELGDGFDPAHDFVFRRGVEPGRRAGDPATDGGRMRIGNEQAQFAQALLAAAFTQRAHAFGSSSHEAIVTRYGGCRRRPCSLDAASRQTGDAAVVSCWYIARQRDAAGGADADQRRRWKNSWTRAAHSGARRPEVTANAWFSAGWAARDGWEWRAPDLGSEAP